MFKFPIRELLLLTVAIAAGLGIAFCIEQSHSASIARLQCLGFQVQKYGTSFIWRPEHIILHGSGETLDDADLALVASRIRTIGNVERVYLKDSNVTENGAKELWLKLGCQVDVEVMINGVWHAFLADDGTTPNLGSR